jgi:putative ABC transport system permease protein
MKWLDTFHFAATALTTAPLRTGLTLLAMTIGVAAVVLLTALGEGARRYVTGEFAALGSHLLIVLPGRAETSGGAPPLLGETPRDLTLADAQALQRSRHVRLLAPLNLGTATVSHRQLQRESVILGSTAELAVIRRYRFAQGQFLPAGEWERSAPVCVIGQTVAQELFRGEAALGNWLRIGDRRFRVIGILSPQGVSMGHNVDEVVMITVSDTQALFNTRSLFRILIEASSREAIEQAKDEVLSILKARHEGEDDITVITQDAVLSTFDKIFTALTLAVGGIAAISLLVAGVLIMNVMLVTVSQRTREIGLLKALGASRAQITALFLSEAALLSLLGGIGGIALGGAGSWALQQFYPDLDFTPPLWAIGAALAVALGSGLLFGVAPARRAARLDPVEALAGR